eukprot:m.161611 g.161611  ORF g.161611 m.161611 type:complete len:2053 (-) comp17651_c0_seq3:286-6444(-)
MTARAWKWVSMALAVVVASLPVANASCIGLQATPSCGYSAGSSLSFTHDFWEDIDSTFSCMFAFHDLNDVGQVSEVTVQGIKLGPTEASCEMPSSVLVTSGIVVEITIPSLADPDDQICDNVVSFPILCSYSGIVMYAPFEETAGNLSSAYNFADGKPLPSEVVGLGGAQPLVSRSSDSMVGLQSLVLDGKTAHKFAVGNNGFQLSGFALWIKTTMSDAVIVSATDGGSQQYELRLSSGRLKVHQTGASRSMTGPLLNDDNWHHVACLIRPDSPSANIALVVDGVIGLIDTTSSFFDLFVHELTLGAMPGATSGFEGLVDDLRVYGDFFNTALTASRITRDYSSIPAGCPTCLDTELCHDGECFPADLMAPTAMPQRFWVVSDLDFVANNSAYFLNNNLFQARRTSGTHWEGGIVEVGPVTANVMKTFDTQVAFVDFTGTLDKASVNQVRLASLPEDVDGCLSTPCSSRTDASACVDDLPPSTGRTCGPCLPEFVEVVSSNGDNICLSCTVQCETQHRVNCNVEDDVCGSCDAGFSENGIFAALDSVGFRGHSEVAGTDCVEGATLSVKAVTQIQQSGIVATEAPALQSSFASNNTAQFNAYALVLFDTSSITSSFDVSAVVIALAGERSVPPDSLYLNAKVMGSTASWDGATSFAEIARVTPSLPTERDIAALGAASCSSDKFTGSQTLKFDCPELSSTAAAHPFISMAFWLQFNSSVASAADSNSIFELVVQSQTLAAGTEALTIPAAVFQQPPVDCVVSTFVSGACSVTCGTGTQQQTRSIVTNPANGGAACPTLSQVVACDQGYCPDELDEISLVIEFPSYPSIQPEEQGLLENATKAQLEEAALGNYESVTVTGTSEKRVDKRRDSRRQRRATDVYAVASIVVVSHNNDSAQIVTALDTLPSPGSAFLSTLASSALPISSVSTVLFAVEPAVNPACSCAADASSAEAVWPTTVCSAVATQPCPVGFSGSVTRKCSANGVFRQYDSTGCSSEALGQLEGTQWDLNNLNDTLDALSSATSDGQFFGSNDVTSTLQLLTGALDVVETNSVSNVDTITRMTQVLSDLMNVPKTSIVARSGSVSGPYIVEKLTKSAAKGVGPTDAVHIVKENLALSIYGPGFSGRWPVDESNVASASGSVVDVGTDYIQLPSSLGAQNYEFAYFGNSNLFASSSSPVSSTSGVVSVTVEGIADGEELPEPVLFSLDVSETTDAFCGFWFFSSSDDGEWRTDGCSKRDDLSSGSVVVCECTHLTNFAVLTSDSASTGLAIKFITYIGLAISVPCLLICFFVYAHFKKIRTVPKQILMHLCINLAIALTVFVFGIDETDDADFCTAIGIVLHFFLLASFLWMLVEGYHLHRTFVAVFDVHTAANPLIKYSVFAYGVAGTIVAVTAANWRSGYGNEDYCWLSTDGDSIIWSFIGPVIFIVFVNLLFFIKIFSVVWRLPLHTGSHGINAKREQAMRGLKTSASFLCIMGATWLFSILTLVEDDVTLQYVAAVLNSFQGLLIFYFHCWSDPNVRKIVANRGMTSSAFSSNGKGRTNPKTRSTSKPHKQTKTSTSGSDAVDMKELVRERPTSFVWGDQADEALERQASSMKQQVSTANKRYMPIADPRFATQKSLPSDNYLDVLPSAEPTTSSATAVAVAAATRAAAAPVARRQHQIRIPEVFLEQDLMAVTPLRKQPKHASQQQARQHETLSEAAFGKPADAQTAQQEQQQQPFASANEPATVVAPAEQRSVKEQSQQFAAKPSTVAAAAQSPAKQPSVKQQPQQSVAKPAAVAAAVQPPTKQPSVKKQQQQQPQQPTAKKPAAVGPVQPAKQPSVKQPQSQQQQPATKQPAAAASAQPRAKQTSQAAAAATSTPAAAPQPKPKKKSTAQKPTAQAQQQQRRSPAQSAPASAAASRPASGGLPVVAEHVDASASPPAQGAGQKWPVQQRKSSRRKILASAPSHSVPQDVFLAGESIGASEQTGKKNKKAKKESPKKKKKESPKKKVSPKKSNSASKLRRGSTDSGSSGGSRRSSRKQKSEVEQQREMIHKILGRELSPQDSATAFMF